MVIGDASKRLLGLHHLGCLGVGLIVAAKATPGRVRYLLVNSQAETVVLVSLFVVRSRLFNESGI